MTINGQRQTSSDVKRQTSSRTAAASARNRQLKAQRLALDLAPRSTLLTDEWLTALTGVLVADCRRRGLPLLDLLDPDDIAVLLSAL